MSKKSSTKYLYGAALLVVIVLIVFVIVQKSGPSRYDQFAQCLTDKGVKMYGAWWCPHCTKQKALFEGGFGKVTYVECSLPNRAMNQLCKDEKIEGYPTWEFSDGTRRSGEISLEDLAKRSACELPVNESL